MTTINLKHHKCNHFESVLMKALRAKMHIISAHTSLSKGYSDYYLNSMSSLLINWAYFIQCWGWKQIFSKLSIHCKLYMDSTRSSKVKHLNIFTYSQLYMLCTPLELLHVLYNHKLKCMILGFHVPDQHKVANNCEVKWKSYSLDSICRLSFSSLATDSHVVFDWAILKNEALI